jgi:hypothetical protein
MLAMPKRNSDFDFTSLRRAIVLFVVLASLWIVPRLASAEEGWSFEGQGTLFYTDDVGLFSATRRLSRDGDPTQPAIDSKLQATQALSSATRVQARFEYAPNQFVGDNEERQSGQQQLSAEKLTSYIWSTRLIHDVTPDVSVKLLGRYGMRQYNEAFSERNTDFWTIGPHVDWRVAPTIKLGLSYHYERGLAEGRNQPQFEDDTSYINHYLSADVDVELTERLSLFTAVHFEHNIWTSGLAGDERNGAHENIYEGDLTLAYRLTESIQVFNLVQRSSRKESFESNSIKNTNVGIGLSARF